MVTVSEEKKSMARKSFIPTLALVFCSLAGCTSLENRLLYHPEPGQPRRHETPSPLQDVALHTSDGTHIHARWFYRPARHGTVLFCHGNAGNVEAWSLAAERLSDWLGESVLLFDYPGYGSSGGKPSEAGCYAAALAAYEWLTSDRHIPAERIAIYGESLGGGVAVDLASKRPHRALILVRTFTSIPDVAQACFPLLPVRPFVSSRFDSLEKIGRCRGPVFIAQADADQLMPLQHAKKLRAACAGPVEFFRLKGLGHNDPLPFDFYVALRQFLQTQGTRP
jgi:fermentation-respiration switch protein FrsA (DUF1100 family)